jgi:hypothetical protein
VFVEVDPDERSVAILTSIAWSHQPPFGRCPFGYPRVAALGIAGEVGRASVYAIDGLRYFDDGRRLPGYVEKVVLRSIQTNEDVPGPARRRREPVRFLIGSRRLGLEVHGQRTVGRRLQLAPFADGVSSDRIRDEEAVWKTIHRYRPELGDGRHLSGSERQSVPLSPVNLVAGCVLLTARVHRLARVLPKSPIAAATARVR